MISLLRRYDWLRPLALILTFSIPLTYATTALAMSKESEILPGHPDGGGGGDGGSTGACLPPCSQVMECSGTVYPDGGMQGACVPGPCECPIPMS